MSGEKNGSFELDDLSALRLIDETNVYENNILSLSIPSILGVKLRESYFLNSTKQKKICHTHKAEEVNNFCRDCAALICSHCLVKHDTHDITDLATAIDEKFDNIAGAVSQFTQMAMSLHAAIENVSAKHKILLEEKRLMLAGIEKRFEDAQRVLTYLRADLEAQVEETWTAYCADYESAACRWQKFHDDRLERFVSMPKNMGNILEENDLFQLETDIKQQIREVKGVFPNLKAPKLMEFEVNWNEKFVNFVNLTSVGQVNSRECIEPFQLMNKFSARHTGDKVPPCVQSITSLPNIGLALLDVANRKVKCVTLQGRTVKCFVGSGRFHLYQPQDLVSFPDGRLLVADSGSNKIVLFHPNGTGADAFGVDSPECVSRMTDNEICIISGLRKEVEFIKVCDERLFKMKTDVSLHNSDSMRNPTYFAYNHYNGYYFVADTYEHCVFIFDNTGVLIKIYGHQGSGFGELREPNALACDRKGQVLLCDTLNHRIHLLDAQGNFIRFLLTANEKIRYPKAICFDEEGALCIAQQDGQVKRFTYS